MTEGSPEERSQSSLKSITHGASLFLLGRLLSSFLEFLLNIILTRSLGPSLYGVYSYSKTIMSFAVILARFGTGKSLLKYIPAHEDDSSRRNRYVGLAYFTALCGSILIGFLIYVSAPLISSLTLNTPLLVSTLRIFSLVLPFNALIKLNNAIFRALEDVKYQVIISDIIYPLTQISLVGAALILGYSLLGVVASLALAAVLVFLAAITIVYCRSPLQPAVNIQHSRSEMAEFYNYSIPLTLKDIGSILYTRIDLIMVGLFLVESSVGIYRVAVLISSLLTLPLNGFNQLFPSIASRLYSQGDTNELQSVYETVTRWSLTVAIPPGLIIGIYSSEFLSVFGSGYTAGSAVLILLALGQITNCAVGPSGFLLMMTNNQYLNMVNQWLLGILNVILNYILLNEYGLIGAALATAGVLAFINILRVVEVWYVEDLYPYSKSFWKPLVAGIVSGAIMIGLSGSLSGYYLLVGGGSIGGLFFLVSLFVLGFEQRDKEFFKNVVKN